jgi:hypothetical protein
MEHECTYVSSRGIVKSCNVHNPNISSSDTFLDSATYSNIQENDIVYVNNSAVKEFFIKYFHTIRHRFILVSGDSDVLMPFDTYEKYVNDTKLIHWFSQNLIIVHPKISHIPIGLDYHTISKDNEIHPWGIGCVPLNQESILNSIEKKPFNERLFGCYVNFHFSEWDINTRGDRQECLSSINKEICYFQPNYLDRKTTWKLMSQFVFVICPFGGGYDTHRLWETLILGSIPIIKSSGLDPLFEDLNVLIVKSWSDVSIELLVEHVKKMKPSNQEKLTLKYWVKVIESKKNIWKT